MPTPFPGMDPYLERRGHGHAVPTRLLVAIADALGPQVWPHYRVDIELSAGWRYTTGTSIGAASPSLQPVLPLPPGVSVRHSSATPPPAPCCCDATPGPLARPRLHQRPRQSATLDRSPGPP